MLSLVQLSLLAQDFLLPLLVVLVASLSEIRGVIGVVVIDVDYIGTDDVSYTE
jgi:hypothetical protein